MTAIKSFLKYVFILVLIFSVFSCINDFGSKTGILIIDLGNSGRYAYPPTGDNAHILDLLVFEITLIGNEETIDLEEKKAGELIKVSVTAGRWDVEVKAFIKEGDEKILYATGIGSVNVRAGQNNPVTIQMKPEVSLDPKEITITNIYEKPELESGFIEAGIFIVDKESIEIILNEEGEEIPVWENAIIAFGYAEPSGDETSVHFELLSWEKDGEPWTGYGEYIILITFYYYIDGEYTDHTFVYVGDKQIGNLPAYYIYQTVTTIPFNEFTPIFENKEENNGYVIITGAAELEAYLATAVGGDNPDNPLKIALIVDDLGGNTFTAGSIGYIIKETDKYISLDISGSTFTGIDDRAFYECDKLVGLTIGNSVTNIGILSFFGCNSLASVTFEGTINNRLFNIEAFDGDLRDKYFATYGGAGTYTTDNPGANSVWTKISGNISVAGITLDETELTLAAGDETSLIFTIAPANATIKTVTWASDNVSVATVIAVNSVFARVTAVSEGTATITVTSDDGGFTAYCTVTVTESNTAKVVSLSEIKGVPAPVTGNVPVTAIPETEEYTGTVAWTPAVTGTFSSLTEYTAIITLTAKAGFTLEGVAANFFTVEGATRVTNTDNSGVVTAVFPVTADDKNYFTVPPLLTLKDSAAYSVTCDFTPSVPDADTYTLYYMAGQIFDSNLMLTSGTSVPIASSSCTVTGLSPNTTYSFILVAKKGNYEDSVSNIVHATTGSGSTTDKIHANADIIETGFDTVLTWSFAAEDGSPLSPDSDIILTYSYRGLEINNGKLTTETISGNETHVFASNVREYTIAGSNLIAITNIVVSAAFDGQTVESVPKNTSSIELRLYNIAYAKSREYGAIEMLSHGKTYSSAGGIGPTVQVRGNTIVNYDNNGNPVNLYGTIFSLGHGGISGAADATQMREWYYDGNYLYGRSNGGAANIAGGGTGETAPVTPSDIPERWTDINSVLSSHLSKWTAFSNAFGQAPFNYIPYNINNGCIGLYEYMYPDPQSTSNNLTSGREDSPFGLIETSTRGALAHNSNGTYEFTILMDGSKTGNQTNIEWSDNVDVTNITHSSITFVFDEDMRFVKYLAMDGNVVATIVNPTNYTAVAMYFVYHKDNIDIGSYATYRPHQLRPNHVNFVDAGVSPESVIAPFGNTATGDMVVADSRYAISLDWIASTDEDSKVSIPRP